MRGKRYCASHRSDEHAPDLPAETGPDERRLRSDAFARAARRGNYEQLIDQAVRQVIEAAGVDHSLDDEIGALRIILKRVIAMDALDGDPRETAATVTRLVDSIVRAVRAQRALSGDLANDLTAALTTVLLEMGLGEEA